LESEQKMRHILRRAGNFEPTMWCGEAKEMERLFSEAARHMLDVLSALGGDGTIQECTTMCRKYRLS
jgi:diacylglycerol kinase family enzyme